MAENPTYSLAQVIALAKGTMNWYEYAKSGAQHGKNNQDDISTLQSAAFSGATPGWQAAIDLRWYVADTSSSTTTYTGATKPTATGSDSLFAGYFIIFKPATNNTGASTLNVASSDGAVDIKKITSGAKVALAADDLDSDNYAELIFDGTDWVLLNPPASAGDFKLDDLGTPDDNTDLNFTTSVHGLVPKGTNTGDFLKDDGTWAGGGKVLQVVSNTWTTATSVASTSYASVGSSATSITPSATTSKILILVNIQAFTRFDAEGHQYGSFEITRDTSTTVREFGRVILDHEIGYSGSNAKNMGGQYGISFLDAPTSTSSLEYALTMKCATTDSTGRVIVNEAGYEAASTMTLMEVGA